MKVSCRPLGSRVLICCFAVFLCACGGEPVTDQANSTADDEITDGSNHILKHQAQAIEKAKGIEQTLQDAAQRRLDDANDDS